MPIDKPSLSVASIYVIVGPGAGALIFSAANAVSALLSGEAAMAYGMLLLSILLSPVYLLAGLPVGLACGIAAATQTSRQGHPGWTGPMLISAAGAFVLHARGEPGFLSLMPLLIAHLGAAAICTLAARRFAQRFESDRNSFPPHVTTDQQR